MATTRILTLAALTCVVPGLFSCAHQSESVDWYVEQQLAEHHTSCLSAERPAHSPGHTACVLSRYRERQQQLERLRSAVAPAPQAAPATASQADWMI